MLEWAGKQKMPYELIIGEDGFRDARGAWDALEARCKCHVFQTWSFLDVWLRTAGAANRTTPLIVTYTVDGRTVAIFPAARTHHGSVPLTTWLGGPYVLDYGDILFDADGCDITADEFVSEALHLISPYHRLTPLYLTNVRDDASAFPELKRRMLVHKTSVAPYVATCCDWETYRTRLSKHTRRNLLRRARAFERFGALEFSMLDNDDERVPAVVREILRLKRERFAKSGPSSGAFTPGYEEFRLLQATAEPHTRVAYLSLGAEFLAAQLVCEHRDRLILLVAAFDPNHAKLSPGLLLDGRCVQYCFENGFEVCDFGWGSEEHKYHWTSEQVGLTTFVNRGPVGRGLSLAARARRSFARLTDSPGRGPQ